MESKKENPKPVLILADELVTGWDSTSQLDKRLESFSSLKHKGIEFIEWAAETGVAMQDPKSKKIFTRLIDCGQYLIFRQYQLQKRSRLIGACSCKLHLLCPFCASRRGVKHSMAYKEKVEHLKQETNNNFDLVFITFTVKNGESLDERFSHLKNSMRRLLVQRTNQQRSKGTHKTEMFKLSGGVFAYEFKRGEGSEDWHPHIHMLALLPKASKINIENLKAEWLSLTNDSHVINIKYADDSAYLEVFAYALKFSEMTHSDRWFAYNLLTRERLISSFGDLRGVQLPENELDEPLDQNEPFLDILYRFQQNRGYFKHSIISQ